MTLGQNGILRYGHFCGFLEAKLFRFWFFVHFLLQGLAWAALGLWTHQNNPQVVGTCPGHGPQPIAQNRVSKSFGPEPPPAIVLFDPTSASNQVLFRSHVFEIFKDE